MRTSEITSLKEVSLGVLLLLAVSTPVLAQGPLFTFHSTGDFASVSSFQRTPTGFRGVFASVNRGGTTDNPRTFLFFATQELSSGVFTTLSGFGVIPNESVSTDNQGTHLTLHVDVNSVPGFQQFQSVTQSGCTISTPAAVSNGLISLAWEKTVERWNRSEGHFLTHAGDLVLHSQGSFASFSATVQGRVFDQDIMGPSVFGTIGTNRNVFIAVERGR